jgi:uncharacterized membrane protein YhaH (DUF805 family)
LPGQQVQLAEEPTGRVDREDFLPLAVAAVAFVLLLGLINMMRGGSPNRSQNLMRLRVLLQFIAIVITMLVVWAMGK